MPNKTLYFNPGCALSLYKPNMEIQLLEYLNRIYSSVEMHKICCHHDPCLPEGSTIINVCSGCDRRFRTLYHGIDTLSIWEVIDQFDNFPLPNYNGLKMTVHDACPIREKPQIHQAIRNLLKKMNINIIETKMHGAKSICCGDDLYGKVPLEEVHKAMQRRADSMPCEDVVVYCVSCIKSMHIGEKTPRHVLDLVFGEVTEPQEYRTVQWHEQLSEYIQKH